MDRSAPLHEKLSDVRCQSTGKIIMATRHSAKQLGRSLTKRTGQRMSAYRCSSCDGWHISKKIGYRVLRNVIFARDVIEEANSEHPRLLIVARGDHGEMLDRRGEWECYVRLANGVVIGCERSEILRMDKPQRESEAIR